LRGVRLHIPHILLRRAAPEVEEDAGFRRPPCRIPRLRLGARSAQRSLRTEQPRQRQRPPARLAEAQPRLPPAGPGGSPLGGSVSLNVPLGKDKRFLGMMSRRGRLRKNRESGHWKSGFRGVLGLVTA